MIARRLFSEFLGTAFLLATVVGTGILAHRIDGGNLALSVVIVAIATGCVLTALILSLSGLSTHFNPIVSLASAIRKEMPWSLLLPYMIAQVGGAIFGTIMANLMFELPAISIAQTARTGSGQWIGELVATFGLLGIIFGCGRYRAAAVPAAVGMFVCGGICFTSSSCFANPAVTIARMFSDTLTGIRPMDVAPYLIAQLVAMGMALVVFGWLFAMPKTQITAHGGTKTKPRQLVGSGVDAP